MPVPCPGCGATRGTRPDSTYVLTVGHRRRLRRCKHCGTTFRTLQPPGEPERLAQDPSPYPPVRQGTQLTPDQVVAIREAVAQGQLQKTMAARYRISRQTVSLIVRGNIWRQVGGPLTVEKRACTRCLHFAGGCDFGFPDANDDPTFAIHCDLFQFR